MKSALGLIALTFLCGCTVYLCENDPITEAESPDKKHVAIMFVRDCGATTDFSTQVSILDAPGKLPNEAGNVLVLGGNHSGAIQWEGNQNLVISGLNTGKEFLRLHELVRLGLNEPEWAGEWNDNALVDTGTSNGNKRATVSGGPFIVSLLSQELGADISLDELLGQDAQNGIPARPQRARRLKRKFLTHPPRAA